MSKPKAPPTPDPIATANAQGAANRETAIAERTLNNTDVATPYGNVTYNQIGTENGVPRYQQTVTESGNQQRLRELQEQQGIQLGQLGLEQTGKVGGILGTPYQSRRLDIAKELGNYGEDIEGRTYDLATRGLDDMYGRSEASLRTQLANRGIGEDSDAYRSEMRAFTDGKGDAYARALLGARDTARTDRGAALGEALTQYGSDTTADLADRQNPMNEIIALLNGVQTNPLNPGQSPQSSLSAPDVMGAIYGSAGLKNQQYQTQQSGRNATMGALAGLGGSALGAFL